MAYFYQHIKGLTSSGTKWWINCEKFDASGMITPEIRYQETGYGEQTLGNIITSNMFNGVINHAFTFKDTINFYSGDSFRGSISQQYNGLTIKGGSTQSKAAALSIDNTRIRFDGVGSGDTGTRIQFFSPSLRYDPVLYNNPIWFGLTTDTSYKGFAIACFTESGTTYTSSNNLSDTKLLLGIPLITKGQYIKVKKSTSSSVDGYIEVENYIKASSYIEGLYFNATSDIRAKTNVKKSTFSALDIVKTLPIYNFKYKSNDSESIGIIAQQALNTPAGDFNLVVNPQASGENGDYMSVKESKLVYIAWKAIQEQQEIIDKQSKEIEELKQLVKTLIEK